MEPIKILVVDDEADLEFLFDQKFKPRIQASELELLYAANGDAALRQLEHHSDVAIALCDIRMPNMDGLTLLDHLREEHPQVCPIMISAYNDLINLSTAMNRGAYDFLFKPIDFTLLNLVLQKAIRFVRQRAQQEQALCRSERQYRQLAEKCGDGLIIVKKDMMLFVNKAVCRILGVFPGRLLESSFAALFSEHEETRITAHTPVDSEWRMQHVIREDRELWVELHEEQIEWQGQPVLLVTVRDVTAHTRYEEQLEHSEARLVGENMLLKSGSRDRCRLGDMIGISAAMQAVYDQILHAASTDEIVLIYGESGTGKELIARTIHRGGARCGHMFVAVNCGAIPDTLFESEFFGYCKGAFTDAKTDKRGFFAQAHQGTLFLDEVEDLSPAMQVKLLRVLEEKHYMPLGSEHPQQADVRILAATNCDLKAMTRAGRMREDFLYRLHMISINVPPLRERKEDLSLLIDHFLQTYEHATCPLPLPEQVFLQLYAYAWPGNVRELFNVLRRYVSTGRLEFLDIHGTALPVLLVGPGSELPPVSGTLHDVVDTFEKQYLLHVLQQQNWHRTNTAKALGIPGRTLRRKISKYQIRPLEER